MTLDSHIVSHTHWDREWYHPLERFRQRLVGLIDELLDDPPSVDESFLLDGQAIVIEDYLEVRPDRAAEIAELLRAGRLEAGPWYVLADELIPGGEALVRNLLAGRRVLRRFDAAPPPALYCPDSFGHPATLPAIAAGFDLPLILLWRGYGGRRWPEGDTVRWRATNGDEVLVFHLPHSGYEFGSHLPADDEAARARWTQMRAELVPRSNLGVTLIPHGADHHARQRDFRTAIGALERAGASDGVHRSSLRAFADTLIERARGRELPRISGELRDSYGYTWSLQGTFATRAHEKRMNAFAERLLTREAEPWSALAARIGVSRQPLVQHAWRTLLGAHPHDTLCGCSIDEVATAMERRIRSATNQAIGVRDDSIADLIDHDTTAAREVRERWMPVVVVRNPAARVRSGVAVIDVEQFVADVPVGPGSGTMPERAADAPRARPRVPELGPLQVLSKRLAYSRTESPRHYPDNDLVAVTEAVAWVHEIPAYGIKGFPIGKSRATPTRPSDRVAVNGFSLRNEMLAVDVSESGVVSLEHAKSGRRIESLLELVDEADEGDLYTPAPRDRPFRVAFRGVRRVHRGPLRGELALGYRVVDAHRPRRVFADVTAHFTLDAGAQFLRIRVTGENHERNHRLRLAVHTDVTSAAVWADAAFAIVRREPIVVSESEAAIERPPATAPLHRYVSLFNESTGATVFSDGLAEYEVRADGTILITLVRGVGDLSRNDLPERPGHAGWPTSTPAAQCLGPFEARFAVLPHAGRSAETIDAIERVADDVLNPLVGTTLRSALQIPAPVEGVRLVGTGLAFSATKQSEDGEWLVLRCINLLGDDVAGEWHLPFDVVEARLARLDETVIGDVRTQDRAVHFRAAPHAILTVLVR